MLNGPHPVVAERSDTTQSLACSDNYMGEASRVALPAVLNGMPAIDQDRGIGSWRKATRLVCGKVSTSAVSPAYFELCNTEARFGGGFGMRKGGSVATRPPQVCSRQGEHELLRAVSEPFSDNSFVPDWRRTVVLIELKATREATVLHLSPNLSSTIRDTELCFEPVPVDHCIVIFIRHRLTPSI